EKAVFLAGCEPTLHVQAALCDFIEQGHYATHIRRARSVYRRRQKQLVDALNHYLEGIVAISPPPGSMHIVLPLPSEIPRPHLQSVAATGGSDSPPRYLPRRQNTAPKRHPACLSPPPPPPHRPRRGPSRRCGFFYSNWISERTLIWPCPAKRKIV